MAVMKSIYPDKILMFLFPEGFFFAKKFCGEGVENWNCHMANPLFIGYKREGCGLSFCKVNVLDRFTIAPTARHHLISLW